MLLSPYSSPALHNSEESEELSWKRKPSFQKKMIKEDILQRRSAHTIDVSTRPMGKYFLHLNAKLTGSLLPHFTFIEILLQVIKNKKSI